MDGKTPHNPAAFPAANQMLPPGMTLLDYFAAKAMQGLMSRTTAFSVTEIAIESYQLAEAMLKERDNHV